MSTNIHASEIAAEAVQAEVYINFKVNMIIYKNRIYQISADFHIISLEIVKRIAWTNLNGFTRKFLHGQKITIYLLIHISRKHITSQIAVELIFGYIFFSSKRRSGIPIIPFLLTFSAGVCSRPGSVEYREIMHGYCRYSQR